MTKSKKPTNVPPPEKVAQSAKPKSKAPVVWYRRFDEELGLWYEWSPAKSFRRYDDKVLGFIPAPPGWFLIERQGDRDNPNFWRYAIAAWEDHQAFDGGGRPDSRYLVPMVSLDGGLESPCGYHYVVTYQPGESEGPVDDIAGRALLRMEDKK